MKSHDSHILFQSIFSLCMWHRIAKEPRATIMEICKVFKQLCTKAYGPTTYPDLKMGTIKSLVFLEKVFPPNFFDLMTHLVVHLMDELDTCGPMHSRWMYPIECAVKDLKGYV